MRCAVSRPACSSPVVPSVLTHLDASIIRSLGTPAWAELFGGDAVVAAAILDRLLDGAAVINIKGGSWRLREHQALTQPLAHVNDAPERPSRKRR